jgi:heptosyltransferase I
MLVVRLGAMGDIMHTLPAVASLKHSFPGWHLTWVVESRWAPLLEENPFVDKVLKLDRASPMGLRECWRELRSVQYEFAVDFQGLVKSALVASCARPKSIFGFHHTQARERTAALFYSDKTVSHSLHTVDRNLDLAAAAGAGSAIRHFPLPAGREESPLPAGDFVMASPLAGWEGKQWPMDYYRELAALLRREMGLPLVLDGPASAQLLLALAPDAIAHASGIAGLIYATRRATAVVGVDSGPLHIAAALGKPGVAIYGPTDPARNGPYGDSLRVLRSPEAASAYKANGAYKRSNSVDESMLRISPSEVFEALRSVLGERRQSAGALT